jgi:hypothetical protein
MSNASKVEQSLSSIGVASKDEEDRYFTIEDPPQQNAENTCPACV